MVDKWDVNNSDEQESDTYKDPEDDPTENEERLTIIDSKLSHRKINQSIRETGYTDTDNEFDKRIALAKKQLSPMEKKLFALVMGGKSIAEAARQLGIKQPNAQAYWNNLKEKLQ